MSHPNVKIHSPLTPALLPFVTYKHVTYNMYVTQLHKCVLCNYDVIITSSFTSVLAAYALHLRLFVSVFLDLASLFPFDVFAFPPALKKFKSFVRIDFGFRIHLTVYVVPLPVELLMVHGYLVVLTVDLVQLIY